MNLARVARVYSRYWGMRGFCLDSSRRCGCVAFKATTQKVFFTTRLRLGIELQSPEVLHFVGKDFPFGLVPENEGARQNRNLKSGKLMARILVFDQQQAVRSLEYSLLCSFVVFIFLSYTNVYSTSFT